MSYEIKVAFHPFVTRQVLLKNLQISGKVKNLLNCIDILANILTNFLTFFNLQNLRNFDKIPERLFIS